MLMRGMLIGTWRMNVSKDMNALELGMVRVVLKEDLE